MANLALEVSKRDSLRHNHAQTPLSGEIDVHEHDQGGRGVTCLEGGSHAPEREEHGDQGEVSRHESE